MSSAAPEAGKIRINSHEKTFTLLQAIAVILVSATVFAASGFLVGKTFFWKSVEQTRVEQQLAFYKSQVDAEPKKPEMRVNYGYTLFLKGNNNEALQQFQIAADLDKKYAAPHYNMGLVYKDMEKYDEALEAFSQAAKLSPRDYKPFMMMGVVYNLQGNYKSAITALNRANDENPGSADVIYQIGVSAEKTGDEAGAKELYQRALDYDPKFQEAKDALGRLK